jgi:hypothetical protein
MNELPWYCMAHRDLSGWRWVGAPQRRAIMLDKVAYQLDVVGFSYWADYVVLAASTQYHLNDMLSRLNVCMPCIHSGLAAFVEGDLQESAIEYAEYVLFKSDQQPPTPSIVGEFPNLQDQRRLEFGRYLYMRGIITEYPVYG